MRPRNVTLNYWTNVTEHKHQQCLKYELIINFNINDEGMLTYKMD